MVSEIAMLSKALHGKEIETGNMSSFETAELIIYEVAQALDVEPAKIKGIRRNMEVVHARHLAIYLMLQRGLSQRQIGTALQRDHSSIIHARNKVESTTKQNDRIFFSKMYKLGIDIMDRGNFYKYDKTGVIRVKK